MLLGLFIILTACSKDETQEPGHRIDINSLAFEYAMKGWELYSWLNGDDWNYSILIGTNRLKSYEEVVNNEIVVTGKDLLKLVLDRFPAGETITWIGRGWLERCWDDDYKNLSLPPQEIIDEITQHCIEHSLILIVTD
jgi:hypothetical protein